MIYHVGDKILCRVNADSTIIFDWDFYDKRYLQFQAKYFEIIGIHNSYYVILCWPGIEDSRPVDEELMDDAHIDPKYLGEIIFLVRDKAVGGRLIVDPYKNPLACKICKEYFPYAQANLPTGDFICWVCRTTRTH